MSPKSTQKQRKLQFQGLEARRLMAADPIISFAEPAPTGQKEAAAYVSTDKLSGDAKAVFDAKVEKDSLVNKLDGSDYSKVFDQIFEEIGVADLSNEMGVGLDGKPISYDTIEGLAPDRELLGGEVGSDGFGPQGYQSTLDGANSDKTGKGATHTTPVPTLQNAEERKIAPYKAGGLNTVGKTSAQLEKACLSLDPNAYSKANGTDTTPDNSPSTGGSLFNTTVDHGKKKSDTSSGGTKSEGAKTTAPAEKKSDDKNTDGGTSDTKTTDGGTPTDGGDPPSAGTPDDPNSPDFGEGYADPNDPVMQLHTGFTDAYRNHTFEANQNGNVTPDPNADVGAQVEFSLEDYKGWVDGVTMTLPTEIPELPRFNDGGDIDPVDEH